MSTSKGTIVAAWLARLPRLWGALRSRRRDPAIVPRTSIAARALVAVVAIMTFLASLTTGAVMLLLAAAADWQADVSREVTIQVRPAAGQDLDAMVQKAVDIAGATPGIAAVRAQSADESAKLLEPWLGSGIGLDSLPIPRLIVVRVGSGRAPDLAALRARLAAEVPAASLDDHRSFARRLRAMVDTAVAGGLAVLALVLIATVLSVSFATRGAMATNGTTVEVLHFIGAKDSYVAGQFQRHFLLLGVQGGAIGGGAAVVFFAVTSLVAQRLLGRGDDLAALFGGMTLGPGGYVALLLQIMVVALVTAATSRRVVKATLRAVR